MLGACDMYGRCIGILVGNSERKRLFQRQRRRLKDNIKMDLNRV